MTHRTHEAAERRMWRDAFCAMLASQYAKDTEDAAEWADEALEEFRKRYPAPPPEPEPEAPTPSPTWEAFKIIRRLSGALIELREAVKGEPAMNKIQYDRLGILVNRTLDDAVEMMKAYPNWLEPSEVPRDTQEAALKSRISNLESEEVSIGVRLAEALGISLQGQAVGLEEMLQEVKRLKEADSAK